MFDFKRGDITYKDLSPEKQTQPCLTDEEILELARFGKKIEKHFGISQDIEWVIDQDLHFPKNLLFVQARPETIWSKKETKSVLETKKEFGDCLKCEKCGQTMIQTI